MSNFRMIHDNAAKRAILTASSNASASMNVANLVKSLKGRGWRSASAAAADTILTFQFAAATQIGGFALAFSNATAALTAQVDVYTEPGDASPAFTTGAVLGCPQIVYGLPSWGAAGLGVNAYAYGGFSHVRVWFPHIVGKKFVVRLVDTANPAGYLEAAYAVLGRYWEGEKNVDYGATVTPIDRSENSYNDAGDLITEKKGKSLGLTFSLSNLSQAERNVFWGAVRSNGKSEPIWFSQYPDDADPALEQSHQSLFKLLDDPAMASPSFQQWATTVKFGEV